MRDDDHRRDRPHVRRQTTVDVVARFDPDVARVTRAARRALRRRFPTATELVCDNYHALAIGFGATDRASSAIVSLAVHASGVNLYFVHGAGLPDPGGRLEGNGRQGRFVRLPDASLLDDPEVRALLDAAVAAARTPLPVRGRGRTMVKGAGSRGTRRTRCPRRGPSGQRDRGGDRGEVPPEVPEPIQGPGVEPPVIY